MTVSGQDRAQAVERAARLIGRDDQASRQALGSLWDEAFDMGRLATLDELPCAIVRTLLDGEVHPADWNVVFNFVV